MKSDDCRIGQHKYCFPCDCECHKGDLMHELLDLITLMPDSQTQEIIDYIMGLRATRKLRDANPDSYK